MDWNAVGSIGEAFSALGLFFVLFQLRHARAEMRRSINQASADAIRSGVAVAMDPRVLRAEVKASRAMGGEDAPFVRELMRRTDLTLEEAYLLFFNWNVTWQANEQIIHSLHEATPAARFTTDNALRVFYGMRPVSSLWYETTRSALNPDAVRYVDAVLANARNAPGRNVFPHSEASKSVSRSSA